MTPATAPTAVIAEDEPVLARTLTRLLEQVWPELRIVGVAEDGLQALARHPGQHKPAAALSELGGQVARQLINRRNIDPEQLGQQGRIGLLLAGGE